jgi:hypothetical protein
MRVALRGCGRVLLALTAMGLGGCATVTPYDYTAFRQSPPRSILVLPPLNESTAVEGTYSYLSTVSQPIAERGYYVFPVAVIDQLLQENGLPTAGEMHQVPLGKLREITGADAVLFATVHEYGSKYQILSANTTVRVSARLVDTRTGTLLWDGSGVGMQNSGGNNGLLEALVGALVTQIISSKTDPGRQVSRLANVQLFTTKTRELPYGPYHPKSGNH